MSEIDELIEVAKVTSRHIIEDLQQEHIPIMLILTPRGKIGAPVRLETKEDKENFQTIATSLLHQLNAYAYAFISEAWMSSLPVDSPTGKDLLNGTKRVTELPLDDREEILCIHVVKRDAYHKEVSAKIKYKVDNSRYLDKWEETEVDSEAPIGRLTVWNW